jgi:hypothetical protein
MIQNVPLCERYELSETTYSELFMTGRWHVFTWFTVSNEGQKGSRLLGNGKAAESYIKKVSHEHPERIYKVEECKHGSIKAKR